MCEKLGGSKKFEININMILLYLTCNQIPAIPYLLPDILFINGLLFGLGFNATYDLRGGVIIKKRENFGHFPIGYFRFFEFQTYLKNAYPPLG